MRTSSQYSHNREAGGARQVRLKDLWSRHQTKNCGSVGEPPMDKRDSTDYNRCMLITTRLYIDVLIILADDTGRTTAYR